jgi:tetratricopeptide (TPR) repeat protein
MDDNLALAFVLHYLGVALWFQNGDPERIKALYEESLRLFREERSKLGIAQACFGLGLLAQTQGDYQQARLRYQESLMLDQEMGYHWGTLSYLAGFGALAQALGKPEPAAKLLGASEALRETTAYNNYLLNGIRFDDAIAAARAPQFAAAWQEGQRMTMEQAVAYALALF